VKQERPVKVSLSCAQADQPNQQKSKRCDMQEEGYSSLFYIMLGLGIIGLIGFFAVAAGAAGGM